MSDSPTKKQLLPLHTHTVYSVLDGASTIDEYLKWCKANGAQAMGVTDHGWQIGALEVIDKAKKYDLIGIPGCEFYVAPESDHKFSDKPYNYYHITAWAVNEVGYRNLIKLGSLSFNDDELNIPHLDKSTKLVEQSPVKRVVAIYGNPKPRITFDELLKYNEGIVIGSGCLIGALSMCWMRGEREAGYRNLHKLKEVFKDRFFLELMPHCVDHDYDRKAKGTDQLFKKNECTDFSPDGDVQKAVNLKNIEIAKEFNLPILMTTDSHFVNENQKPLQDVLLQNGDPDGWRFFNSYHMITTDQAWEHWKRRYGDTQDQRKIFAEGVENNHVIAEMAKDLKISTPYKQPEIKIPAEIVSMAPNDRSEQLKHLIIQKIEENGRMHWDDPEWTNRLDREMKVICDNGQVDFSNYFLFLEHWSKWSREYSILSAPGRGSGAGSLLCYLLKITHLNPFDYDLPFERFLSEGRIKRKKYPDIDWDISYRDPLIAKLNEVYGDKFAQVTTHQSLKIKSALKDACRVLLNWNSNDKRINDLTRDLDNAPMGVADKDFLMGYKDQEGNEHEGLIETNLDLKYFLGEHPEVKDMVLQLLGIPRAVGRHASAYLISDTPIWETVPTCRLGTQLCTQFTAAGANYVEKAGLIKFDFLSVLTLRDIALAIRLVQRKLGYKVWKQKFTINNEEFDLWQGELQADQLPMGKKGSGAPVLDMYNLPMDDGVFVEIAEGKTQSLFQISSALLTDFCVRVIPESIRSLSDIVALCRPGPLKATIEDGKTTMAEAYIKRRHGLMPITYVRPDMEPFLKDTYGVCVYQEQQQAMFQHLLGYSAEEADELREVLAKKKKQEMEKRIPEIRQRCIDRGWTEAQTESFISLALSAAQYSFNRAHSASYGTVAYQCAFLKHHFVTEWWCAVLNNAKVEDIKDKGFTDAIRGILEAPHVNGPTDSFDLDDKAIHAPLYLIEDVGDSACKEICDEREKNGNYKSLQDFWERVDGRSVNQAVIHNMIMCDCFRFIEPTKSANQLITEYHELKKVASLKVGKDLVLNAPPKKVQHKDGTVSYEPVYRSKVGDDLRMAVDKHKAKLALKGEQIDVPVIFTNPIQLELQKIKLMSIYRVDVLERFKSAFKDCMTYSNDGRITLLQDGGTLPVYRNNKGLAGFHKTARKYDKCVFAGLPQSVAEFEYIDKKTTKKVKALKIILANDGDTVEVIFWPNQYAEMKALHGTIPENKMFIVLGSVVASKEVGKFSIFGENMIFLG